MTSLPYDKSRNLGLDIVRSIAILSVLFCHVGNFFPGVLTKVFIYFGIVGVEIFFVLSGFLIGKIIITDFSSNPSLGTLKDFIYEGGFAHFRFTMWF